METPPPTATAMRVVETLRQRDGTATFVELAGRQRVTVFNIAWGQDFGDPEFHITTNISPAPIAPHAIDTFNTGEVRRIVDPETTAVLFEAPPVV